MVKGRQGVRGRQGMGGQGADLGKCRLHQQAHVDGFVIRNPDVGRVASAFWEQNVTSGRDHNICRSQNTQAFDKTSLEEVGGGRGGGGGGGV